jgi:hypothetical protein
MVELQPQDHTGKKAHQHNDLGGFGSDKIYLLDNGRKLLWIKNQDQGAEKKDRDGAQVAVDPDCSGAERMKNPGKGISGFR